MRRLPFAFSAAVTVLHFAACGDDTDPPPGGGGGQGGTAEGGQGGSTTDQTSTSTGGMGCETTGCPDDAFCFAGECRACEAPVGVQHDVTLALGDGEEDRYYFLYVPASYDCSEPAPLLVDFHGTAGGNRPEEAYQLDALVALADEKGAIVVRPRSRSIGRGGQEIYRWDQNPGDLDRNVVFTQNLVEALRSTYHVDESRMYASGFSSGSNMTSQFLGPSRGLFRGLAPIAGGVWANPGIDPFEGDEAPRLYLATGYRDYLQSSVRDLETALADAGVPDERILVREYDTGHDLFTWHFPELWSFLDEGIRPEQGALAAGWTEEALPDGASVLTLTPRADGSVVASGARGEVWRRDVAGSWHEPVISDSAYNLSGACSDAQGNVYFVGETSFVRGTADLALEPPATVPEFFGTFFGAAYSNGVGCRGSSPVFVGGYWSAAHSEDQGTQWSGLEADAGGYTAQASTVHVTDAGTIIAVGYYDYIGRGGAGAVSLDARNHPSGADWLNDVASAPGGSIWVVGDHGTVLHSADDGISWEAQSSPVLEDLYAVSFASDGLHGAVAGRRGTVLVTTDGGQTWEDVSLGSDVFVGAVAFLDATTFLIAGEKGLIARRALD